MKLKRVVAGVLSATLVLGAASLMGCGKSGSGDTCEIWLYQAQDAEYYKDYADNPVLQYLLSQDEWSDLDLEFTVPPAGTAQDNYSTMVTSGDFPTLMQNSVSDPAPTMYDNGYIQDITDYVKEYMPNYYKLIQSNDELKEKVVYNIDGEDKILSIATVNESAPYTYSGLVYRRDWIVKYGKNPSTGEAFTGSYTNADDLDSWEDDVKFPSWYDDEKRSFYQENVDADWDGSTPVYISDWEWMFEIFTAAQKDLGITDSYSTSVYYPGYTWAGGLCSCFGEGSTVWYYGSDGKVKFGGTEDSMRAYLTCMNNWYEKGWLDSKFNERTSDMYYAIDSESVRQGKVGMWTGLESDLGGRLDTGDGYTQGIYVAGCAYPINDEYGGSDCQYVIPRTMNVDTSVVSTGFFVMEGATEKQLEKLLPFLDYFYTEEGAALRTVGLSKDQYEASEDKTFYEEHGLSDGAYTKEGDKYVVSSTITGDSGGLSVAATLQSLPGLQLVESVDKGYATTYENSLKSWTQYENKGRIWGSTAYGNMSTDDTDTCAKALTKVLDYMERNTYRYIKGEIEINDKTWKDWCKDLEKFNYDDVSEILQGYLDKYPL